MVYWSVSPGVGPGAPRSTTSVTICWVAIDLSARVWTAALLVTVRGALPVPAADQVAAACAVSAEVPAAPVAGSTTGLPPASTCGMK